MIYLRIVYIHFFYRIDKSMSKESHVDISTAQSYMHYFFNVLLLNIKIHIYTGNIHYQLSPFYYLQIERERERVRERDFYMYS